MKFLIAIRPIVHKYRNKIADAVIQWPVFTSRYSAGFCFDQCREYCRIDLDIIPNNNIVLVTIISLECWSIVL